MNLDEAAPAHRFNTHRREYHDSSQPCTRTALVQRASWFLGAALLIVLGTACSAAEDTSGTTGRAIRLQTKLAIRDDLSQPRTNAHGWDVSITQGLLSVGALYYYSGDPVLSQRLPTARSGRPVWAWLDDLFVKSAHAHPGHYVEGAAMGQMLKPTTVDLLQGPVALANGDGVTGRTNSATFRWQSPPEGELAAALDGHVVAVRGVATKDGTTLQFLAHADLADVLNGDQRPEVAGCAFGDEPGHVGVDMDDDGTVTLTLVPRIWFEQVDFQFVAPGTAGAPQPDSNGVIDLAGTLAWRGFVRGVKKGTAYEFSYSH